MHITFHYTWGSIIFYCDFKWKEKHLAKIICWIFFLPCNLYHTPYSHYPNPLTNLTLSLKSYFLPSKLTLPQIKILRKIIEVACFLPLWAQDVFVHASRTIKKILPDNQSGKTQVSGTAKVLLLLKNYHGSN